MKGISPLVAAIFVVAITIASVTVALRVGAPVIEKSREASAISDAEFFLQSIDSAVREISAEGESSSRRISIKVSNGEFVVDPSTDEVVFTLESEHEIISHNSSFIEGPIYFNTTAPKRGSITDIKMTLNYTSIDFLNSTRWGEGSSVLFLENEGKSGGQTQISTKIL